MMRQGVTGQGARIDAVVNMKLHPPAPGARFPRESAEDAVRHGKQICTIHSTYITVSASEQFLQAGRVELRF